MMSDRLRARLRALDCPEEPSPAFRESLYQQLARRADIAAPSDLPWTAPVAAPVKVRAASGRRRWLPLLAAAVVATSLAGGLAALSTRPAEQACEPALAQTLAEAAPGIDYTYTAEGIIDRTLTLAGDVPVGDGQVRLSGRHSAPDRTHEQYLEGKEIALIGSGADESLRIGLANWFLSADAAPERPWRTVDATIWEPEWPNLALLPRDRVAFLLQGSTEPASAVDWTALTAPDGGCRLTGTIVPSPSSAARRTITVEIAPNAALPTSIHEEWTDYQTQIGAWTHDVTWRFTPSVEPVVIEPPAPDSVAPPMFSAEDLETSQFSPRMTIDGLGGAVVDVAPGDPDAGDIRVTVLEIREDTGYGQTVPFPGTTFLAVKTRQEALEVIDGGAGSLSWLAVSSDGAYGVPLAAWRIEGGYEPVLDARLGLQPGESLEGWMHLVAPITGGVDMYWHLGGSTVGPSLRVKLRSDPVIGSGEIDGVPWEAVAYEEIGRLCTAIRERPGDESGGGAACGPRLMPSPGIFPSMSGEPLIAHGVTSEEVATVRLETTTGNVDVSATSLASLGVPAGGWAVAVPSGAEVIFFVGLDGDGVEVERSVGPAAPSVDDPAP